MSGDAPSRGSGPSSRARTRLPDEHTARQASRFERNSALVGEEAYAQAREAALTLLDHADRSSGELRARLEARGYPTSAIEAVVARLSEVGLVNDRAYAFALARTRFHERGVVGPALVGQLRHKHVDEALISEACAQIDEDAIAARALELACKKMRTCAGLERRRAWSRCLAYLARRGYSSSVSSQAVREAWEQLGE